MMSIDCNAAISTGDGSFVIDRIKVYDPQDDEVRVKVMAAGVCHTDYDSLQWKKPFVLGHEGSGVVDAVGKEVQNFKVGDSVILNWATPCLECFQCKRGNQHICENNSPVVAGANGITPGHAQIEGTTWRNRPIERSFNIGTLSEYTLVKESALVKLSSNSLSFKSASIISCGVMTGYGSVVNATDLGKGDSAVVLGTGGVGLNVIQGARIQGAEKIIAIDINPKRLEMAVKLGATHTILADRNDTGLIHASDEVKKLTQGRGAD